MKTITITLRKETIQSAYNELKLLRIIGAAYAQKRSPMSELLYEIKREVKRKKSIWERIRNFFI
tara:strand:+ start:720 stop:911 length:192 start_codon:yes stop_codon:yes gene_type:complete